MSDEIPRGILLALYCNTWTWIPKTVEEFQCIFVEINAKKNTHDHDDPAAYGSPYLTKKEQKKIIRTNRIPLFFP